ncbi:MAG: PHP domain-containing protein [Treponema sp.]|jgi:histidinol phosphatase-like PHP family hydrolase|nr:PHP domain-containing protein [Treponema sp.]
MSYLYETHLHTARGSACGVSGGRDYIKKYRDSGFAGIMVTDHFFNGNTAINRNLPWKQWVEQFLRGYQETRNEGEKLGLDVFFGWEETYKGDDYLVYGLDGNWLLAHPESARWSRKEQFDAVHAVGGCIVHAHPFRAAYYIRTIHLAPKLVDAVEIANACNDPDWDSLALEYAVRTGLPVTAGSDIHDVNQFKDGDIFGVYLDKKMETIGDYVEAVRNRAIAGLKVTPGRGVFHGGERPALPVDLRDENDRGTRQDFWGFMGERKEPVSGHN